MTRPLAILGTLALLVLAPTAFAQDEAKPEQNTTRPDDAAWVDDCPPDMMCAYEEPTRGPADGSCENCRGDNISLGPEDCIECTGAPVDDGATCMDGADAGEACEDVQYIGGPNAGDAPTESEVEQDSASVKKDVPALPALGVLAALVVAVVVMARRS